jgi:hypothetical protein
MPDVEMERNQQSRSLSKVTYEEAQSQETAGSWNVTVLGTGINRKKSILESDNAEARKEVFRVLFGLEKDEEVHL